LCFIELGVTYLPFTLARAFTTFRLATIYLPKLLLYDNFRWKCHPLQYKFVLDGVTFPAETVMLLKWVKYSRVFNKSHVDTWSRSDP